MGFLTGGPFYHLLGRTGNNVGRVLRGKNTFSMRPHPSSKAPTEAQLDVRLKFSLMTSFLSWITPLIEVGFREYDSEGSAMNAAMSYNYKYALTGTAPNFTIDFDNLMYSRGRLSTPASPELEVAVPSQLKFNWLDVLETEEGSLTDLLTVMVYNPAKNRFVMMTGAAARSALTYTLAVPEAFSGDTVECYMSFVAVGGKKVSNSVYVGSTEVM